MVETIKVGLTDIGEGFYKTTYCFVGKCRKGTINIAIHDLEKLISGYSVRELPQGFKIENYHLFKGAAMIMSSATAIFIVPKDAAYRMATVEIYDERKGYIKLGEINLGFTPKK